MIHFANPYIISAMKYALQGGQSLHTFPAINQEKAPEPFKRHSLWGHLLDQDIQRLRLTARELGVHFAFIHREGKRLQHIDLCGAPLDKALAICDK